MRFKTPDDLVVGDNILMDVDWNEHLVTAISRDSETVTVEYTYTLDGKAKTDTKTFPKGSGHKLCWPIVTEVSTETQE
ncbi:hypothetical protein [Nocardia pseudovaccinii]|uniref:hypothetical protein n=1 Tax=Nocardia pseudovaccinii TaxID=189540 RepID=UPI0012F51F00|nr:hypothetical protein [Nocardia pseudovaccinii]